MLQLNFSLCLGGGSGERASPWTLPHSCALDSLSLCSSKPSKVKCEGSSLTGNQTDRGGGGGATPDHHCFSAATTRVLVLTKVCVASSWTSDVSLAKAPFLSRKKQIRAKLSSCASLLGSGRLRSQQSGTSVSSVTGCLKTQVSVT